MNSPFFALAVKPAARVAPPTNVVDPASGAERHGHGFPVRITTMPSTEKNASALNVSGGYVYAVTSGYIGDAPPYVGHVVAIRARSS